MGEVYLAEDTKLDRQVALKILPAEFAEDSDRMSRFVREAKSASALNHPNIITIYEIGESEGTHYIATEFIDGKTLDKYAQDTLLNFNEVLEITTQIASALQTAHSANIIHRDIKPENVMIRQDGLAKILDFGIAKLSVTATANVSSEGMTAIKPQSATMPGTIIGTANYMSPEQAKGKEVDARSDIFSFGVVLYEMLTGHLPFEGETALEMIGAILKDEPKPIDQDVPDEISAVINKCLTKERNERYQTIKDVLDNLQKTKQNLELQQLMEQTSSPEKEDAKTQKLQSTIADDIQQTRTDQTAHGKPLKKYVAAALAVLLISITGFFGYTYYQSTQPINSIAVLPFENNGSDADSDYLSDGLAESLIYRLSQLPDLKVSPTSSVFRYKGKATDPTVVAQELGVDSVLTGRINQRGDDLNISVELIDVRKNKLIWGEKYQRKFSELLTTQRQIATEISQNLMLNLSGNEKGLTKPYTDSNEAYQLYLKGRYHFAKQTKDDFLKSIEYFQQAIKLDPNFAMAHIGIADVYNQMPSYDYLSPRESLPKAKMAAQRALEIDPTLAEAHAALADSIFQYDWDWEKAELGFKRSLELNPNVANTHFLYGLEYLVAMGRTDEAIVEMKRAEELEPLNMDVGASLAAAYMYDRQFKRALEQALKIYAFDQNFVGGRIWLATMYAINEKYSEAIAICEKGLLDDPTSSPFLSIAGYSYAKNGQRQMAEQIVNRLKEVEKTLYVSNFWVAVVYGELGKRDEAFAELEKAYQERDYFMPRLKVEPFMDSLRDDPRFKDLVKRMGLPE